MDAQRSPDITMLPLARISTGYNPRRYFDQAKHDELVASLRLRGMLQPMLLRPSGNAEGGYEIVAGGRRYRAALDAFGPDGQVPVLIREMTDQEALEAAIDENDVRDDASETEQADAAVRALAACEGDRAEAARRLGWSPAKLDRRLALANLADAVKVALDERRIKVGHAELLAAVPPDKQDKALGKILGDGLDVTRTRDLLMRVMQDLANAPFDKTECIACPFNSAAQRALFETHVDDGHCTNPDCFKLKIEAHERAVEEEQRAAAAATAGLDADQDAESDGDDDSDASSLAGQSSEAAGDGLTASGKTSAKRSAASTPAGSPSGASGSKAGITVTSIAGRTADLREAKWRTAVARALAGNPAHARTAILVGAMSGTLSEIKPETLTARAGLLVGETFPSLDYKARIAAIDALSDAQTTNVLSAIAAAYARDVHAFKYVADLARAFEVDLRASWRVDQPFLERYTKDELRFVAQECGLVAHIGERGFAKLLAAKKAELIGRMLNTLGFDWTGRVPSSMTLDGQYGPPPAPPPPAVAPPPAAPAAETPTTIAA